MTGRRRHLPIAAGTAAALVRRRGSSRRRGLGLIELLVSLAITSLLLTGMAVAVIASSRAVHDADDFTRASQAARVAVNHVMSLARQCQAGVVGDTSLELKLVDGTTRIYALDASKHELQVTYASLLVPEVHPLARNVNDVRFGTDGNSISMTVTVQIGSQTVQLNGSALPRRSVTYK